MSTTKIDMSRVARWLVRYGALMDYLDQTTGYGQYVVTLHGRHAVSVSASGPREKLEQQGDWAVELAKDSS
jgi:hypothetical protein